VKNLMDYSIGWADTSVKAGDNYKNSEITLLNKVDDLGSFTGPGLLSPFNPYEFHHSAEFIRGFSNCIPSLNINVGSYVLDSGSGYSWTTEWFMKMGVHAVGLEINRTYLDVGRRRMGLNQPHLIIADAENLPFADGVFDAILGFDAFHHIPDRPKAMRAFERVLKNIGRVVLVEPGGAHEMNAISQSVMQKYGTMEIGMELSDVQMYIDGI
ncbi:class I SAM-dependent methyltransferase, partial [Methylobacterium sp. WL30]